MIVDAQENQYRDAIQILEILASAINIKTLPLPANGLCRMQQKANFIGNLFFKKTSYLQASL